MQNCEYFQKLISDNLDDNLDKNLILELKDHINNCDNCDKFQNELLSQSNIISKLPHIAVNSEAKKSIVQNMWNIKVSIPVPLVAAALIVFCGVLMYQNIFKPNDSPNTFTQPASEKIETMMLVKMESQSAYPVEIKHSEEEVIK